jgi:hypothetical protein
MIPQDRGRVLTGSKCHGRLFRPFQIDPRAIATSLNACIAYKVTNVWRMSDSRLYESVLSFEARRLLPPFNPHTAACPRGSLPRRVCLIPCFPRFFPLPSTPSVSSSWDRIDRAGRVGGKQQSPSWIAKSPNQFGKKIGTRHDFITILETDERLDLSPYTQIYSIIRSDRTRQIASSPGT